MLRKSSVIPPKSIIYRLFDFIEEGSTILEFQEKAYLIACKESSSFQNFSEDLEIKIKFNPVMQNDFPIVEVSIKFYKKNIYIDEISTLISISNNEEVHNLVRFFLDDWPSLLIFSKGEEEIKSFEFKNNFMEDLDLCLKNFEIDIKDIMKNT